MGTIDPWQICALLLGGFEWKKPLNGVLDLGLVGLGLGVASRHPGDALPVVLDDPVTEKLLGLRIVITVSISNPLESRWRCRRQRKGKGTRK